MELKNKSFININNNLDRDSRNVGKDFDRSLNLALDEMDLYGDDIVIINKKGSNKPQYCGAPIYKKKLKKDGLKVKSFSTGLEELKDYEISKIMKEKFDGSCFNALVDHKGHLIHSRNGKKITKTIKSLSNSADLIDVVIYVNYIYFYVEVLKSNKRPMKIHNNYEYKNFVGTEGLDLEAFYNSNEFILLGNAIEEIMNVKSDNINIILSPSLYDEYYSNLDISILKTLKNIYDFKLSDRVKSIDEFRFYSHYHPKVSLEELYFLTLKDPIWDDNLFRLLLNKSFDLILTGNDFQGVDYNKVKMPSNVNGESSSELVVLNRNTPNK